MEYAEIIIRYTKKMPPTTLEFMRRDLVKYAQCFTPKLEVKLEPQFSSNPSAKSEVK